MQHTLLRNQVRSKPRNVVCDAQTSWQLGVTKLHLFCRGGCASSRGAGENPHLVKLCPLFHWFSPFLWQDAGWDSKASRPQSSNPDLAAAWDCRAGGSAVWPDSAERSSSGWKAAAVTHFSCLPRVWIWYAEQTRNKSWFYLHGVWYLVLGTKAVILEEPMQLHTVLHVWLNIWSFCFLFVVISHWE